MTKVVYFATGAPEQAAADLKRLSPRAGPDGLRVIAPSGMAPQLEQLASLRPGQMLAYSPFSALLLWLRLWKFLGLSPHAEIICLKSSGGFRSLKFLALTLRGRVSFSDGNGILHDFNLRGLLWFQWVRLRIALAEKGPVCIIGSASPACLKTIIASVRQRYPDARLYGLLPASLSDDVAGWFDSFDRVQRPSLSAYFRLLPRCLGRRHFEAVVLPCTNENNFVLRWLAWWLPVWHIEIYNENADAFSGRNPYLLARHWLWRMGQQIEGCLQQLRYVLWRMREQREWLRQQREKRLARRREQREWRRQQLAIRLEERKKRHRSLPVGVVGSASGLYLKRIIPVVRASFPEAARLHALLPAELEGPASGLFDSATILKGGFGSAFWQAWKALRAGQEFQCWIVPCTNEPYSRMKLLAFLLPLTRRHIYNELADGYPVRKLLTLYRHLAWRMRDHLSFQIVAGTAGKNPVVRLLHLLLYALRLVSAAPLLWKACRRSSPLQQRVEYSAGLRGKRPTVDLVVLDPGPAEGSAFSSPHFHPDGARMRLVLKAGGLGRIDEINEAIRNSQAEFICLMDSRCRMPAGDWLERLLETFDERTGQVGPQIVSSSDSTYVRGLLLDGEGAVRWNSDNAVCWRGRPEWLAVDALPWVCVLFRRSVFLQVGFFGEGWEREPMRVDLDFCRRLAAHGWHSICNQSVTAVYPMANDASDLEPALPVSSALGISEDGR